MKLFQITTAYTGESYAWAENREQAAELFRQVRGGRWSWLKYIEAGNFDITELFDAADAPFCTTASDSGFDRAEAE
jgi:hypothetical protein